MTQGAFVSPLRPEEIDQLLASPAARRLDYCLEEATRLEELWGLEGEDGWVRVRLGKNGPGALALWPRQELAALAASDPTEQPGRLGLDELLDFVLPELDRLGQQVALFPHLGESATLSAQALTQRLEDALDEED